MKKIFTILAVVFFIPFLACALEDSEELKKDGQEETGPLAKKRRVSASFQERRLSEKPQKSLPLDVFDVADYFLMKDKLRKSQDQSGYDIDPLKIQKLCYYAQGYYLSNNGIRLFDDDITENFHGPFIRKLHNKYKGYFIEFTKKIDFTEYPKKISDHLDTIYDMNISLTGKQLEVKTHQEDPWKTTSHYGVITDDKLKDYFIKDSPQVEYSKRASRNEINEFLKELKDIITTKKGERLETFMETLKRVIDSKKDRNHLIAFLDVFEEPSAQEIWEDLEKMIQNGLFSSPILSRIRWPHQTSKQSFLGSSFLPYKLEFLGMMCLPKELEELYDSPINLYGRSDIRYKLSLSARYRNPIALYHLSKILDLYGGDDEKEERDFMKKKSLIFSEDANTYFTEATTNDKTHPFLKGVSYIYLEDRDKAQDFFKKAVEVDPTDEESCYMLLSMEGSSDLYEKAKTDKSFARGLLIKGNNADTDEEALDLYLQAGQGGVAEGYYKVAQILNRGYDSHDFVGDKDPFFYLEEAGKLGMLTAYDFAADLAKEKKDFALAKKFYTCKGDMGDPLGYYNLAALYEEEKNISEAMKYYKKAGPLIGGLEEAKLKEKMSTVQEAEKIKEDFRKSYEKHFEMLIKIATNEERSIDMD